MTPYFGDFAEDSNVYIPFNTFDSNDPSASVTITNLADADIKVHKDGGLTQIATDGATVAINYDGITGNHLITIDTSAHADYAVGSDYQVRIEGTTVDAGTINAFIGSFSIENRFNAAAVDLANGTDGLGALKTLIDAIKDETALIVADTNELQSDDTPTAIAGLDTKLDTIDNFLDTEIAAILVDTGTTLPATLATIAGYIDTEIGTILTNLATVDTVVDGIQTDLSNGTDGLGALKALIDTIDNFLDTEIAAILVDTGTTLPALIATAQADLDTITSTDGVLIGPTGIDALLDEVNTGATHNVNNSIAKQIRQIDAAFEITSGTADGGSANTIELETGVADAATDDIYAGDRCVILAGTGAGEHGLILSYDSSTQIATMSKNWVITPDATSEYILTPADCDVEMWNDNTVTGDGDWAALKVETALIVADTNELQSDDIPATLATIAGYIDTEIQTIITNIAALENIAASDVLTQVNAALDTAISELGVAAPAATPTLRTGLMLMYMMSRNKLVVQTSGTDALEVYNDAGTKIASKALTDDGSDFTEAEMS